MLSIVCHNKTPRLKYVCAFIFAEQFGMDHEIVDKLIDGNCISYGSDTRAAVSIPSAGLIFEEDIRPQQTSYKEKDGKQYLFYIEGETFPFDIFSAIFYLLSRYEEYLLHQKDHYGRYDHQESVAYQKGFLHKPIIDEWLNDFKMVLLKQFPDLVFKEKNTVFTPTYDIDIAYSFLGKGWWRNLAGFLKAPSVQRLRVLAGRKKDPYDAYDWLDELHKSFNLQPIYFFLVAAQKGKFDKNISVLSEKLAKLIVETSSKYKIGIHPSWKSFLDAKTVRQEFNYLSKKANKKINLSRQHYIRLMLPDSYRLLAEIGITDDYSMGYGSSNGFRSSTANSFYWFDVEKNCSTSLITHPFCYMDATSIFVDKKSASNALEEMKNLYTLCKKNDAPFISIFHNSYLGDSEVGRKYRKIYLEFVRWIENFNQQNQVSKPSSQDFSK